MCPSPRIYLSLCKLCVYVCFLISSTLVYFVHISQEIVILLLGSSNRRTIIIECTIAIASCFTPMYIEFLAFVDNFHAHVSHTQNTFINFHSLFIFQMHKCCDTQNLINIGRSSICMSSYLRISGLSSRQTEMVAF